MFTMKVSGLGPIKDGEIGFGDLTVICGDNNTGKSYLAATLHGYLDFLRRHPVLEHAGTMAELVNDGFVRSLLRSREAQVTLPVPRMAKDIVRNSGFVTDRFNANLDSVFAAEPGAFPAAHVAVDFDLDWIEGLVNRRIEGLGMYRNTTFARDRDQLILRLAERGDGKSLPADPARARQQLVEYLSFRLLSPPAVPTCISTSVRAGVAVFASDLDLRKLLLADALQDRDDDFLRGSDHDIEADLSSRYALSIRDELDFMRSLYHKKKMRNGLSPDGFLSPHEMIEEMLDATFVHVNDTIRMIANGAGDDDFNLPLDLGSASAKELVGLYFHLKHRAQPGSLLFLDEPESHLSTGQQMRMAHLVSVLLAKGVRIVLTTHSEVLLKELNNLIMLHQLPHAREQIDEVFSDYRGVPGLDRQAVRCYCCADHTVVEQDINDWGMTIPAIEENLRILSNHSILLGNLLMETKDPCQQ